MSSVAQRTHEQKTARKQKQMTNESHPGTAASFRHMVANDTKMGEAWNTLTTALIAEAKELHGVELTPHQLAEISSIRLCVMTGDTSFIEGGKWWAESQKILPAAKEAAAMKELHTHLNSEVPTPEQDAILDHYAAMKPADRLAAARANGVATPKAPANAPNLTAEERASALRELDRWPRSERLNQARRLGLA